MCPVSSRRGLIMALHYILCFEENFFNPPPIVLPMALKLFMMSADNNSGYILYFSLNCFIFRLKNALFVSHVNTPLVFRIDHCIGFSIFLYNKQNIGKCPLAFASFKCLIKLPELEFSLSKYIFSKSVRNFFPLLISENASAESTVAALGFDCCSVLINPSWRASNIYMK